MHTAPRPANPGVSIHAPVKGATMLKSFSALDALRFNSRTRKGCDVMRCSHEAISYDWFQFTHP